MIALLFALQAPLGSHSKLEASMFWVGATLAFLPLIIIAGLVGFTLWNRRKSREAQAPLSPEPGEKGAS